MKKISIVYQDCPMCGVRKEWGDEQLKKAGANKMEIVKVPFYTDLGKEYCAEAIAKGIKKFPFFTDGEKYGLSIDEFIEKPKKKRKKGEE